MLVTQTPLSRLADSVCAHYVKRPDLIVALLHRLGAEKVRQFRGQIRSTCPVHMGSNDDAFAVWFDKGYAVYRCHTDCGEKGTLSQLLMRKYNATFEQAVMFLAQFAGIQVTGQMLEISKEALDEETSDVFAKRIGLTKEDKPTIFPEMWADWSHQMLFQPAAAEYLDYLTGPLTERTSWGDRKRQMPIDVIKRFQIGFVPGKTWYYYDSEKIGRGWAENRISFPWRLITGECIGFAGRRVDGKPDKKYKTYPGTQRSFALWGLHDPMTKAAIMRERKLVMLEGYTDVMRARQHRCDYSTALGGLELTAHHLRLIRSWNLDAVVMYLDPDKPGAIAAYKAAEQLRTTVRVYLATPPTDEDPGELVDYNQFWTPIVQAQPFTPKE